MKSHELPKKPAKRPKTLPCHICMKMFAIKAILERHLKFHEEEVKNQNKDHVKFISDNFDMKCDCCDVIFTDFYDACRHYKKAHGQNGYLK